MPEYPIEDETWAARPKLDLFAHEALAAVEAAVAEDSNVVFGWHHRFASGPDFVCFTRFESYLAYIERARPGDHFALYDANSLAPHALIRTGRLSSSKWLVLDDEELRHLDEHLDFDDGDGLVLVRRFLGPLTGTLVATVEAEYGLDGEGRRELLRNLKRGLGELLAFPMALFDIDEDGDEVKTVTPRGQKRRHVLVDAKRPTPEGLVPPNGPY